MSSMYTVQVGPVSLTIGDQFVRIGVVDLYLSKAEHSIFVAILGSAYPGINMNDLHRLINDNLTAKSRAVLRTHISSLRKKFKNLGILDITTNVRGKTILYRIEGLA
jgi:DNA-binding response OmpR family regulator